MRKSITGILSFGAVVSLAAQVALVASGCSSADDSGDGTSGSGGSSAGSAGTPAGGSSSGSGGTPAAGSGGSSAGSAGTPAAGSGGSTAGECVAIASPLGCSGIRNNMACAMEGQACAGLPCGVSDVGRRACTCTGLLWTCEACTFPMDFAMCPIMEPPNPPLEACDAAIQQGLACSTSRGQRCMSGTDVCICWPDDEGVLIWDCDTPPPFWAAP